MGTVMVPSNYKSDSRSQKKGIEEFSKEEKKAQKVQVLTGSSIEVKKISLIVILS